MSSSIPAPGIGNADQRLGPYRLVRPISAGGMAWVYEGRLDSLAGVSTRVAIKVIHPEFAKEGGFQELFINEARISARLEHQNLVRVQAFNKEDDLYYLVMEYIDGITLRKVISLCRRHNLRVPPSLVAEIGRQVCDGLAYAHTATDDEGRALDLVHRDLKPSNLMLNAQGVLKLLDFGISYASHAKLGGKDERGGAVKGTWGYMAPEQAEGERVGPGADVFGLAAVLYELAAREPLFEEKEAGEIRSLLSRDEAARRAASLGGSYADLGSILVRALQRDTFARYKGATFFGRSLGGLVTDPIRAHEGLVKLYADLRDLESPSPTAPGVGSVPSLARPSGGKGRPPPPAAQPPKKLTAAQARREQREREARAWRRPVLVGALIGVSLFALIYAGFVLSELPPRRSAPVAPRVTSAPVAAVPAPAVPVAAPPVAPAPAPAAAVAPAAPIPAAPSAPISPRRAAAASAPRTTPPADPGAAPSATPAPAVEAAPAADEGLLTVSSVPRARVMIDGQYVRFTPLFQHALAPGPHTVLLVAEDGRRKTFRVELTAEQETRKLWLFEEERWGDL